MSGAVYVFAPDKVTYLNVPLCRPSWRVISCCPIGLREITKRLMAVSHPSQAHHQRPEPADTCRAPSQMHVGMAHAARAPAARHKKNRLKTLAAHRLGAAVCPAFPRQICYQDFTARVGGEALPYGMGSVRTKQRARFG